MSEPPTNEGSRFSVPLIVVGLLAFVLGWPTAFTLSVTAGVWMLFGGFALCIVGWTMEAVS